VDFSQVTADLPGLTDTNFDQIAQYHNNFWIWHEEPQNFEPIDGRGFTVALEKAEDGFGLASILKI
jgi:hypothetical protein